MFSSRGVSIHSNNNAGNRVTANETIMDIAIEYTKVHRLKSQDLQDVNIIRKKASLFAF